VPAGALVALVLGVLALGASSAAAVATHAGAAAALSHVDADFDGDGFADFAVFRPAEAAWYVFGEPTTRFGLPTDAPVPADYDGNGITDIAVFRPSVGGWYRPGQPTVYFGATGDAPVPADYDGDGDDDIAVFRPGSGGWLRPGEPTVYFGVPGDVPVPADYDGDGDDDVAIFRPSSGGWLRPGEPSVYFGRGGDVPVPADYDGDDDADIAVFRTDTGGWLRPGQPAVYFGLPDDIPGPADYDGDGDADIAVFRPGSGGWMRPGQPTVYFGASTDVPLQLQPGVYRAYPDGTAPTDISLSSASVAENQPSGTTVGTLAAVDADAGDTAAFAFVAGTGDSDNGSFQLVGSTLVTNAVFDFETKASYSVRLRVSDSEWRTFDEQFAIAVNNLNEAPVNGVPGAQSVDEDTDLIFSNGNGNAISIADDAAPGTSLKLSLDVAHGTVTFASTSGLTFVDGTANGGASVHVTGTLASINAALPGLAYRGVANYNGPDTLTVATDDLGNSGSGGPQTDSDVVSITVVAATVVYALGDGADGSSVSRALANHVIAQNPDRFFYLGDVYETGTATEFANNYEPLYGALATRTDPVLGNHESANRNTGYYPYWQGKRGWNQEQAKHRSYIDHTGWQVIAYSSEQADMTAEAAWVAGEVAKHGGDCRIVLAHKGRHVVADTEHGDILEQEPVWAVIKGKTALNIVGHNHIYGRLAPEEGVTVMVSGAGGHALRPLGSQHHTVVASKTGVATATRLVLRPGEAVFSQVDASGTVHDSGVLTCTPG
jgi:hypothetical protein